MSDNNKTVWSEGMFLRPQHFQQHDRYVETLVRERCGGLQPYDWGIKSLTIDTKLLALGKFSLVGGSGIFPDGTPFNLPENDDLPLPIDIPIDTNNCIVYLCLPANLPGTVEVDTNENVNNLSRYRAKEVEIKDANVASNLSSAVLVAKLHTKLMLQHQERAGYVCIGLARIIEAKIDKNVIFEEHFIPSSFDCYSSEVTKGLITRIYRLLQSSGFQLAGKASESGTGGVAEIADYMKLQIINRAEPLFEHLQNLPNFHPESLYRILVQLAGELCTFSLKYKRRAISFSAYNHDDLQSSFKLVMQDLPDLIGDPIIDRVMLIDLSAPQFGIRVGVLHDVNLLNHASFVLAVNAQMPIEQLRQVFPAQVKIAPVEQIANLIRNALPGISIHALPVAPRQIRFNAGFTYFELNKQSDLWREMSQSGGFAIHIAGEFPGLELEFWAIPVNKG